MRQHVSLRIGLLVNALCRLLCMLGMLCAASIHAAPVAMGERVPDFTLRDQFDRPFHLGDHGDSVVVIICGDREGSSWTGAWGRAARIAADSSRATADSSRVHFYIRFVADLRGVPGFMHGYVKGKFRPSGKSANPVLLDWDGTIARTFTLMPHTANAFVLDPRLTLTYAAAGQGLPAELAPFCAALRRAIEAQRGPTP